MATKNNVSHHNKIMFHIAIKHSKTDSIKTQTYILKHKKLSSIRQKHSKIRQQTTVNTSKQDKHKHINPIFPYGQASEFYLLQTKHPHQHSHHSH